MPEKLTFDYIYKYILDKGYVLLDKDYKSDSCKMTMQDENGYLYYTSYGQIRYHNPSRFFNNNPYTEHNIRLWIEKTKRPFSFVEIENPAKSKRSFKNVSAVLLKCNICPPDEIPFCAPWSNIISGSGCSICHGKKVGKYNSLQHKFPNISSEWDYSRNELSPDQVTSTSGLKVYWICEICNESFSQRISDRTRYGRQGGCKNCFRERWIKSKRNRIAQSNRNLTVTHPDLLLEWDYSRNKFSPNSYTHGSNESVYWLCSSCNFSWSAPPSRRTGRYKSGCPSCSSSKGEDAITKVLKELSVEFVREKTFSKCKKNKKGSLRFDFFIPLLNLVIEYDGAQHYFPVRFGGTSERASVENLKSQKIKDRIKNKYCRDNGINLLRIPYWDFDKIEEIVKEKFS